MINAGKFRITAASAIVAFTALFPLTVIAQEGAQSVDQLQALRDCRAIEQNEARLACFDSAIDTVIAKQDSGEIRVVDKEDIAETRRGLFGFSMPRTGIFAGGDDEADEILNSTITSIRRIRSDEWEITLEAGSVWQASNTPRRFKPKVGDSVELEKAALSSYWFRVDGELGVKAKRVR